MILEFCFYTKAYYFGDFLDFVAKKSGLEYSLLSDIGVFKLYVKGEQDELENFINTGIAMVPQSVFLQKSEVKECEALPKRNFIKSDFVSSNITPYALKNGVNEFGESFDEKLINDAIKALNNGESIEYNGLQIAPLKSFDCDYVMPVKIANIARIFVVDELSIIALASFERPVLRLKTSALFRQNHEDAPLSFNVRLAYDLNLFKICEVLENISFLGIKSKQKAFSICLLTNSVLINSGFDFSPKKANSEDELIKLILAEKSLENKTSAVFNLSKNTSDFIRVFKGEQRYEMLSITLPKSYDELYARLNPTLLDNFKQKFTLKSGEISAPNSFYGIFSIIKELLGFDDEVCVLADEFMGQKGVRISYKIINKNELDIYALISSAMSFALAGADKKNISFGLIESLAFFISDMRDILKDELGCVGAVLCGDLFSTKSLANLSTTHVKASFSEIYPLEI